MNRILTLQKNFFKKNLKDIISFSIILFISTILLTSSLVVNNNINNEYDIKHKRLNTANSFYTISKLQYSEDLLENIKNIKGVNEVEKQEGIFITVPIMMEDSLQDQNVIFYNYENERKINRKEDSLVVLQSIIKDYPKSAEAFTAKEKIKIYTNDKNK